VIAGFCRAGFSAGENRAPRYRAKTSAEFLLIAYYL
jgi:hypothetical protein